MFWIGDSSFWVFLLGWVTGVDFGLLVSLFLVAADVRDAFPYHA